MGTVPHLKKENNNYFPPIICQGMLILLHILIKNFYKCKNFPPIICQVYRISEPSAHETHSSRNREFQNLAAWKSVNREG